MSRPSAPLRAIALLLSLLLTLLGAACTSAAEWRERAEAAVTEGRFDEAQDLLRQGLEDHPDDVRLLVAAGELHLRPLPEDLYKPRLALHYAMRADRAADNNDPAAASLLMRAWRANGGSAQADRVIEEGLASIGHPDARAPKRLGAVDPDLLTPTPGNLREQARRDRARELDEDPCGDDMGYVASAAWPLSDGRTASLPAFCAERSAPPGTCSARGLRACTPDERDIACGPMAAVLGPHPSCAAPTVERCCAQARDIGAP